MEYGSKEFNQILKGFKDSRNWMNDITLDIEEGENEKVYTLETKAKAFEITRDGKFYVVSGERIENLMRKVNIGDFESLFYLQRKMDEMGINQALKKQGIGLLNSSEEGRISSGAAPLNTIFNGYDDTVKA